MIEVLWAILLVVILLAAWLTNLFALPGNWLMLVCAVVYWLLMPVDTRASIGVWVLVGMAVLAAIGELIEFLAGSAGVSKAGGSRRSALYAILGSIVGAIVGIFVGVPVPLIGPIIGSVLFGSLGAMGGAMYGEWSVGREWNESFEVGKGAFWGRALGTVGKMLMGLVMIGTAVVGLVV